MEKNTVKINDNNLERLINECVREVVNEVAEEGRVGDWFRKTFSRNQQQPDDTEYYNNLTQKYDPFAPPQQHDMTDTERQAVDAANQRSEVFQARERIKELINDRKYYMGAANRCMGQAKNLCKQYGINIGEIMKEMGITNNSTKKYDASVYANDMSQAMATDDAMDEGKKKNKRFVNEARINKIVESVVRNTLRGIKKK
jgi:hypothetical protein